MNSRKHGVMAGVLVIASAVVMIWVVAKRKDRYLTMQEQLSLGHSVDCIQLDTTVPEIAAAIQRARASLPEFIKRVPRYDRSLEPASGIFVGNEVEERKAENQRRTAARCEPPDGPRYLIRASVLSFRIPDVGRVMPHIWLPHARYDEREDVFWCLLPEDAPPWCRFAGETGFGVPSKAVDDWMIVADDRVEGAYTTRALKEYAIQSQP